MKQRLTLEKVAALRGGAVGREFDAALSKVAADVEQCAQQKAARKINLQIEFLPPNDDDSGDEAGVTVKIKSTCPPRQYSPHAMKLKKIVDGRKEQWVWIFDDLEADDLNQATIDDEIEKKGK